MLIDQQSQPSILSRAHPIEHSRDILQIVYLLQREDIEDIQKVLNYYFRDNARFDDNIVKKMKHAAQSATMLEKGVDYVVETVEEEIVDGENIQKLGDALKKKGKKLAKMNKRKVQKVIIIDPNTGFKKPGNRWENYLHEMVEVKENVEVKSPTIAYCCIPQRTFFKMYDSICGVTGTIGDKTDRNILIQQYCLNLFKVPRNIPPNKVIYEKERPKSFEQMKIELTKEIVKERNRGRPVLLILDSINRVDEMSLIFPDAGVIKGTDPQYEREVVEEAGKAGALTIATLAAGRGVDFKLDERAEFVGGLHVIVPYLLPNVRALEQAIGRSGRQGQPGSATVYVDKNDKYEQSVEFHETHNNLNELQLEFAKYIKKNYSWIYDFPVIHNIKEEYNFGMTLEEMILKLRQFIKDRKYSIDEQQRYANYVNEMIMISWGSFYSNISSNLDEYRDREKCFKEYYDYIQLLEENIPKEFGSTKEVLGTILKTIGSKIAEKLEADKIADVLGSIVSNFFGPVIGATVRIAGGIILNGGFEVIKQLKQTGRVNWFDVFISCSKGALTGVLEAFDVTSMLSDVTMGAFDKLTGCIGDASGIISGFVSEGVENLVESALDSTTNFICDTILPELYRFRRSKEDADLADQAKSDMFKLRIGDTRFRKFVTDNKNEYEEPIDKIADIFGMYRFMKDCTSKLEIPDPEKDDFKEKLKARKKNKSFALGFRPENKEKFENFVDYILQENDVEEELDAFRTKTFSRLEINKKTHKNNVKIINDMNEMIDIYSGIFAILCGKVDSA